MNISALTCLNAKSQSFTDSCKEFNAVTVADLAACLAGTSPIGELVLRRRYIDNKERGNGYLLILKEVIFRIYKEGKQPKNINMIEPLLNIALEDYIGDNVCEFCNGRVQIITEQGKVHRCRSKHCIEGKAKRKDHQRAKILGVKALDYSRYYKQTYLIIDNYLTKILPEAESAACKHVENRMRADIDIKL